MTTDDIAEAVVAFILRRTRISANVLNTSTQMARDLGLDGTDAYEFFDAFAREFKVDMSAFDFAKHFGPEGLNPASLLSKRKEFQPVEIADLIEAARSKVWTGIVGRSQK